VFLAASVSTQVAIPIAIGRESNQVMPISKAPLRRGRATVAARSSASLIPLSPITAISLSRLRHSIGCQQSMAIRFLQDLVG